MIVIGVDPGPEQSAFVEWDGVRLLSQGIVANCELRDKLAGRHGPWRYDAAVFEQVESYGMAVGRDVFETVHEAGRMFQVVASGRAHRLPRRAVKLHLCESARARDSNIRQALIDRFGGSRSVAVGTKKARGPLYGIRSHEWSALAIAVTWFDQHAETRGST